MWHLTELITALQAKSFGACDPESILKGYSTDTRKLQAGGLFVALEGPHFDGHDFVLQALGQGAIAILVSDKAFAKHKKTWQSAWKTACFIVVPDTLAALQQWARLHRNRFTLPLIAISGSNGKTSTKEMLASILSQQGAVLKTDGNRNNHIGLPLTLLGLKAEHDYAVIELGINHPGEMKMLSDIAQADIAILTNVGPAHLEALIDLNGVASEKRVLFERLAASGIAIINADDPFLAPLKEKQAQAWTFALTQTHPGAKTSDLFASDIVVGQETTSFILNRNRGETGQIKVRLHLTGQHQVQNALAAATAASALGLDLETIAKGLSKTPLLPQRTERLSSRGIEILFDAYNANPASVQSAINLLTTTHTTPGRRVAVLGDMYELGASAKMAHHDIGAFCAKRGIDLLIAVGEYAQDMTLGAKRSGLLEKNLQACRSLAEAEQALKTLLQTGDTLLIKGSRGMELERLLPALGLSDASKEGDH